MWKDIGLIGRDRLLSKIHSRIKSGNPFVLIGEPGIGKSAVLQWGFEHDVNPNRAIIVCSKAYSDILKDMCDQLNIDRTKKSTSDLERELLTNTGYTIYCDDLHRATPKLVDLIKALRDRHTLYCACRDGKLKENIRQVLWGVDKIELNRLSRKDSTRIVSLAIVKYACKIPMNQIVSAANGVPGKMHSYITTGSIPREDTRMRSEEIDIAPVLLIGLFCVVMFRYVGRSVNATDLTIIGYGAMILTIVGRGIISKG